MIRPGIGFLSVALAGSQEKSHSARSRRMFVTEDDDCACAGASPKNENPFLQAIAIENPEFSGHGLPFFAHLY